MTEDPVKYGSDNPLTTSQRLVKLKERLDAQDEELNRLRAEIEDLAAGQRCLIEEIDKTFNMSKYGGPYEDAENEKTSELPAAYDPYEEEGRVTCYICGRTYLKGECHECPDVD